MTGSYDSATYAAWRADPEGFWREAATGIDWDRPPERIFDASLGRLWPLVPRRPAQHLPQRGGPACGRRPRRPARA